MSREKLHTQQSQRLVEQVRRLYDRVPFYRGHLDAAGVRPEDIRSRADIALLPLTSKYDMREVFPYGLLAVPREEIVEVHMSSGTTGKSVVDAYTRGDLHIWGDVMGRTLDMGGVNASDVLQVAYGYGLFTGGFGAHYGGQQLGATVLPVSSGNTHRQLDTLVDFGTTALCCTPSYALYIAEYAAKHGVDLASQPLRVGFFGAEPWSLEMRAEIERRLGITAFDIYGLTEVIGPGVAAECPEQDGLHVFEDHFYPEIIDPDTAEPVADGEPGELVLTTLTRQGSPVLRYRTRDITYLIDEPCACGRNSRRIHRLMGRADDMLIVRGVNVFPQQVEQVLLRMERVEPHYRILLDREGSRDVMTVEVEMSEGLFSDDLGDVIALERSIEADLHSEIGLQASIVLVNPHTIERSEGKARRVFDRREVTTHV